MGKDLHRPDVSISRDAVSEQKYDDFKKAMGLYSPPRCNPRTPDPIRARTEHLSFLIPILLSLVAAQSVAEFLPSLKDE